MAQRISSSRWCLRTQDRSYPVVAFYVFLCSISPENSGSVKNRRCKTCIYPTLIREIFSRRGPLSSGVIMCMYGNFTVRLVTVHLPLRTGSESSAHPFIVYSSNMLGRFVLFWTYFNKSNFCIWRLYCSSRIGLQSYCYSYMNCPFWTWLLTQYAYTLLAHTCTEKIYA